MKNPFFEAVKEELLALDTSKLDSVVSIPYVEKIVAADAYYKGKAIHNELYFVLNDSLVKPSDLYKFFALDTGRQVLVRLRRFNTIFESLQKKGFLVGADCRIESRVRDIYYPNLDAFLKHNDGEVDYLRELKGMEGVYENMDELEFNVSQNRIMMMQCSNPYNRPSAKSPVTPPEEPKEVENKTPSFLDSFLK